MLLIVLIFYKMFFICKQYSKDSLAKYYRHKARERYQSLSKKKKNKSNNVCVNNIDIVLNMKNKGLLSAEKIL